MPELFIQRCFSTISKLSSASNGNRFQVSPHYGGGVGKLLNGAASSAFCIAGSNRNVRDCPVLLGYLRRQKYDDGVTLVRDFFLYHLTDREFEYLVVTMCKRWLGEGTTAFAEGRTAAAMRGFLEPHSRIQALPAPQAKR